MWAVFRLLVFINLIFSFTSAQTSTKIYFKTFIKQKGYVIGDANANIDSNNKLSIKFNQIFLDFPHTFHISLLATNDDGSSKKKQTCTDLKADCILDLSSIMTGSAQINVENDYGDKYGLYFLEYSNNQISFKSNDCALTRLEGTNYQCICDSTASDTSICKDAMPEHCYNLPTTSQPKEVALKVPSFKLYSEDRFTPETFRYVFDDITRQYYTIALESIPTSVEASPYSSTWSSFRVRVTPTKTDSIAGVRKSQFIVSNFFDSNLDTTVLFDNAFCKSEQGSDKYFLTCACCERNWEDKICQTKHASPDLYFITSAFNNYYGFVRLTGQAWVETDKKFHIQLSEFEITNTKLLYTLTAVSSDDSQIRLHSYRSHKLCSVDISNVNTAKVKLYVNMEYSNVDILVINVNNGEIKDDQESCSDVNTKGYYTQCLCDLPIGKETGKCIQSPKNCSELTTPSNPPSRNFKISIQGPDKIDFPVEKAIKIEAFDNSAESSAQRYNYLFKFEPMDDVNQPEYGSKTYWPTKVHVVSTGNQDQTKSLNSITEKSFNFTQNELLYFGYAYCQKQSDEIFCTCCSDGEKGRVAECKSATAYTFSFSNNIPEYGYLTGSGLTWSLNSELYMKWKKENLNGIETGYMLTDGKGADTKSCKFNELCSMTLAENVPIGVKYYIDDSVPASTGIIEVDSNNIKIDETTCSDIKDTDKFNVKMCLCPQGQTNGCQVSEPIKCASLGSSDNPASISFEIDKFEKPTILRKQLSVYVRYTNKIMHVLYEPIDQVDVPHYLYNDVFRLRLQLHTITNPNNKLQLLNGEWNFGQTDEDLYEFEEASCMIEILNNGKQHVKCLCCDNYRKMDLPFCVPLKKPNSELKIQFSTVINDEAIGYGAFFGQFAITLDENQFFTIRWMLLESGFTNSKMFQVIRALDNEKQPCTDTLQCTFKFSQPITNDIISVYVILTDSEGKELPKTKTLLASLNIESKKLKDAVATDCKAYDLSGGNGCYCPTNKDFDSNCKLSGMQPCRSITGTDLNVNGRTFDHPTFYLNLDKDPKTSQIYVSNGEKYYTFNYLEKKPLNSKNKFIDYVLYIKPTQTNQVPISTTNKIELNFAGERTITVFEDVLCNVNADKTEWLCQCCLIGECKNQEFQTYSTALSTTTVIFRPSTTLPFDPTVDPCDNPEDKTTDDLCKINESGPITASNLDDKVAEIEKTNIKDGNSADLNILNDLLEKFANVKDANVTQRTKVIDLFDQTLSIKKSAFEANGQKISNNLFNSVKKIISGSTEDLSYMSGKSFGVHKKTMTCKDKQKWMGMKDDGKQFKETTDRSPTDKASIQLSLDALCKDKSTNDAIPAYFIIFRNDKLFNQQGNNKLSNKNPPSARSVNKNGKNRCSKQYSPTNNLILTSVLMNKDPNVLAQLRFKKEQFSIPQHGNLAVTWWDKSDWSQERQCVFKEEGDEYVAHCNHLTDFALLVEKTGTDPVLCDTTLDKLGFWLSIVSLIALFIMILIYSTRLIPVVNNASLVKVINNQRRSGDDAIIISYIICMCLFYLFFVVFIDEERTHSAIFCKLTAAFLYYLFLTAMMLNMFQAWLMIKACAWTSMIERILQIATRSFIVLPVCLGFPLLVCIIAWFTDTNFFYRGDQFCWIRPQSVIFAVLIPVTLMLLNSFVTFCIFCVRMFPDFFSRFGVRRSSIRMASAQKRKRRLNIQLYITIVFAQFVLGFPWILQYPAMFSSNSTIWHYLFAIFNGSNGLILFFIFAYGRSLALLRLRRGGTNSSQQTTSTSEE